MSRDKRQYWGKTNLPLPELDLIAIQKNSYQWYLDTGIKEAFKEWCDTFSLDEAPEHFDNDWEPSI